MKKLRLGQSIEVDKVYDGYVPAITPESISLIIPVRDNQPGIDKFLRVFFETQQKHNYPLEIIIVDNNSLIPIQIAPEFLEKNVQIKTFTCKTPGPASARNLGVSKSIGDWLLFCDSDCIPTDCFITGYIGLASKAIVYSGTVKAVGDTFLERFYDSERILMPQRKHNKNLERVPLYIVTANAIIYRQAFIDCGRFNESFNYAGSEDVEISIRLWKIGNLAFNEKSIVLHDYGKGLVHFLKRFTRYGRGNWQLEAMRGIEMKPTFRKPKHTIPFNYVLRVIQHICLFWGYYLERYIT